MFNLIFKNIIIFIIFTCLIPISFAKEIANIRYQGSLYNIFFHPLIAYPKLAFNSKNTRLKYIDSWFVTTSEFIKIILELYEKGFVLVSPKDLFEEKIDKQGHVIIVRKTLFLPAGKKPLILSLDDYNFYPSMKAHGTIHRFWVDEYNRLATITDQNGHESIRYDQEVPQLLESFIAHHPDFSFNHARGIMDFTGYNGILGYNTNKPYASDYSTQVNEAKKVIRKLKEMGWEFGSHSYFHQEIAKLPEKPFEASEKRWVKEVGLLIGPTSYYIFPFGDSWNEVQERMKFLGSLGFKYFFGVSSMQSLTIKPGYVVMDRFPMDGLWLRGHYKNGVKFATPSKVFDRDRPKKLS